jgi:hypothetical protein
MSKKHFIALADHIRDANKYGYARFSSEEIETLANFCRNQNSRFNRERWLAYIAGECGPNGGKRKAA